MKCYSQMTLMKPTDWSKIKLFKINIYYFIGDYSRHDEGLQMTTKVCYFSFIVYLSVALCLKFSVVWKLTDSLNRFVTSIECSGYIGKVVFLLLLL